MEQMLKLKKKSQKKFLFGLNDVGRISKEKERKINYQKLFKTKAI
jgi:hypothetical protein